MVASDSLRNVFAEQMFTLQQKIRVPKAILKNFSQQKDALETMLATKTMSSSSLFRFSFFCYWHGKHAFVYLH